jgi:8-amino-7-oxononanoate synthase
MNFQFKYIQQQLDKRKKENALRELKCNHHLFDFCSNDYLGFSKEKEIHQPTKISSSLYGATGSRLISGNHIITEETEVFLANFYKAKTALIFNSGYNANVGLFQCVPQRNDTIIYDEYIHASIRDGIRLSNAKNFSFEHNNLKVLEEKLKLSTGLVYVAVESIYSMDGDMAPLSKIARICKKYKAALIVDEAHAVGVFGNGKGLCVELGIENDVFARVVTFGKAYGCHGAAVLGSKILCDYLINFSRAFIYTTALPVPSIYAIKNAHNFLLLNKNRIAQLKELITYFKLQILNLNFEIINSESAIQCFVIPGNDEVKKVAVKIQEQGFDVRPILSPTVPKGKERLRICLHSFNTKEQIDFLINVLKNTTSKSPLTSNGVGRVNSNPLQNVNTFTKEGKEKNHPPNPPSREGAITEKTSPKDESPKEKMNNSSTTKSTLPLRGAGGVKA